MWVPTTAHAYQERKLGDKCTQEPCDQPQSEDSTLCGKHLAERRARERKSKGKRRRMLFRAGQCIRACGNPRPRGRSTCAACDVKAGRVPRDLQKNADAAKAERIAAATKMGSDGRLRYRGQEQKGMQPAIQLDAQDVGYARQQIDKGMAGLHLYERERALHKAGAPQALPRIQREDIQAAALHEISRAQDHLDGILGRRHFFDDDRGHALRKHGRRG